MTVANPFLVEQFAVGVKTEATHSVANTPVAGTDYIYCTTADLLPEMNQIERDYRHNSLDALADAKGDVIVNVVLEGEYQGGAAASGYHSGSHALEQAAGMLASQSTTEMTYIQESTSSSSTLFPCPGKSCTIVGAYRTNLITVVGVYGNLIETHAFNGLVKYRFEGKGIFSSFVTGSQPTPTYAERYINVLPSTASVHSYTPEWSQIEINYGNTVEAVQYAGSVYGYSKVMITKRRPMISFDALMDITDNVAGHDFIGRMISKEASTFRLHTGKSAGRRLVYSGSCQYRTVDVADRNGINVFNVVANVTGSIKKELY